MITILYYFFIALYNITAATVALWRGKAFENEVTEHFACEALGNNIGGGCSKDNFNQFDAITNTVLYVWFNVYPLIFFIYIINYTFRPCLRPGSK